MDQPSERCTQAQQQPAVRRGADTPAARAVGESKPAGLVGDPAFERRGTVGSGRAVRSMSGETGPGGAMCWTAARRRWERWYEALVTAHDLGEAAAQAATSRPWVRGRRGWWSGAGAFQLIQEPQPFLGEGQAQGLVAGDRRQGRQGGGGRVTGGVERGGEIGEGGVFEQVAHGEFEAEGLAHPRHHLDGAEGMAAEGEEVVVAADPFVSEQLGPDPGEELLGGGLRRDVGGAGAVALGDGEGLAVDLAVGGEGRASRVTQAVGTM